MKTVIMRQSTVALESIETTDLEQQRHAHQTFTSFNNGWTPCMSLS